MTRLRFFLIVLIHFAISITSSYAEGVRFFHGSWSQVLAEARRQNKPIFVDVYTTWCGPCKLMSAQAFPNARVGSRMNDNFINYKLDAEKAEGQTVAQRYGVQAFPTSLFISIEGKLIRRTLGYNGIDWFLAEANRALSDANESHTMALWNKKFDAGDRSPEFLMGMLRKQAEYDRPTGDVLDEYVKILPKTDTLSNDQIKFLSDMLATTFTTAYTVLARQSNLVILNPAKQHLAYGIATAFNRAERNDLNDAVAAQDELLVESLIKNKANRKRAANPLEYGPTEKPSPEQKATQEREADDTRLKFYKASRLQAHYVSLVKKIAETRLMTKTDTELALADSLTFFRSKPALAMLSTLLPDSVNRSVQPVFADSTRMKNVVSVATARQLCDLAKGLTDNSSDKKDLALALRWSARAVQIDNAAPNVITHARMLTRLGRKPEARQQLEKATGLQANEQNRVLLRAELIRLK